MRRGSEVAGLLAAVAVTAVAARSQAQLRLEAQVGARGPLGNAGLALAYAPGPWLSVGAGVGLAPGGAQYALFARGYLLRRGPLAIGPAVAASLGGRVHDETYQRPQYVADELRWRWSPAHLLAAGIGGEVASPAVSLRFEAGMAYILNRPSCRWATEVAVEYEGPCNSPMLPAPYHFAREPGRLSPYLTVSFGFDVVTAVKAAAASPPVQPTRAPPTPPPPPDVVRDTDARVDTAWAAPTALTQPRGAVALTAYAAAVATLAVGLTDRLELTAGGGRLLTSRREVLWDGFAKLAIARTGRLRASLLAGGLGIDGSWWSVNLIGAGPVASICLSTTCASQLSVAALIGWTFGRRDEGGSRGGVGAMLTQAAVVALARHLALVAEVDLLPTGAPLLVGAVRVPFRHVCLDAGVINGPTPVASATIRW